MSKQRATTRSGEGSGWFEERFAAPAPAVRDGVPSVTSIDRSPPVVDEGTLSRLLAASERRSVRDALRELPGTERASEVRTALFEDAADAWRIPVAEHIDRDCLDVNAGFGTRSLLLAELADEVHAVDPSLDALRFLDRRDDYAAAERVSSVHATLADLPTPTEPYRTVVADLTGRDRPDDLSGALEKLSTLVAADGSLLLLLDGWPRLAGLTDVVGVGTPTERGSDGLRDGVRASARGYERLLNRAGFDAVDVFGLVPDPVDPSFAFPVNDDGAVRRLFQSGLGTVSGIERAVKRIAAGANELGILDQCWPGYLVAARRQTDDVSSRRGLLCRGGSRSAVLSESDGDLGSVTKIPHRRAHAEFIQDEAQIVRQLRESGPSDGSVPSGTETTTRFGPAYVEQPVDGTPLSRAVTDDVDRFRAVLEIGFDWLTRFQTHHGTNTFLRSPETVREELSIPPLDLSPPAVDDPIPVFRTPCHGDFHPKNVFVADDPGSSSDDGRRSTPSSTARVGAVTAVIDWELATMHGNPIVDPAFFALQTSALAFGDLETGIETAFATETPYSAVLRDVVDEYCTAVGVSRNAFLAYLPYVWIRRLRLCADRGATASYTGRALRRADDVQFIWDRREAIERVLSSE